MYMRLKKPFLNETIKLLQSCHYSIIVHIVPILICYHSLFVFLWVGDGKSFRLYARLILQNFGARMQFRIDVYVGSYLALSLCMMLLQLLQMFSTDDPQGLFFTCLNFSALHIILVAVGILVYYITIAANVNQEYERQRLMIVMHAMKMESELAIELKNLASEQRKMEEACGCTEALKDITSKVENTKNIVYALDKVISAIEISDVTTPLTVLGVEASTSVVVSILTVITSAVSSIASSISKNSAG